MLVSVKVTINDPLAIQRPVQNIDGWRDDLYDLRTREQVLEHLAYNAVVNGRENALMLDGWADLPEDAVQMVVFDAREYGVSELGVSA